MDVDFASLHKVLKDPTRRDIVMHLNKKGQLTYTELMNLLEVTNTGKLNYHLKILNDLIQKGEDGKYSLTERGELASQLLQKFPEKPVEPNRLRVRDALLIGIVGFLLLLVFPLIYLAVGSLALASFLAFLYELLLPGAVMWWLTTRRAKSHDFYDLLQPPIVPLALIIVAIVVMVVARIQFSIFFTGPSSSDRQVQVGMMGGTSFLILGFLPFIGVIITESLYILSKRL
jgi:hypothetical protein